MDARLNQNSRINSRKVYYINGHAFISDKGTKNGKLKAEKYCYDNLLNSKDIVVFDSEMEFKYFLYLLQEGIGEIEIHKNFLLLNEFEGANGEHHDRIIYEADFVFRNKEGKIEVVDVKGFVEDVFYLKWKLFDFVFREKGLALKVVRLRGKNYLDPSSWVELKEFTKPQKQLKKQREELSKLKKEKRTKEVEERKLERIKARYKTLKEKAKLTSAERKRLVEVESILKREGIII